MQNRSSASGAHSLHLVVGGLLVSSTFVVASLLSAYYYKLHRDTAYSDLLQKQEVILEKMASKCTIPLATFDLPLLSRILTMSGHEHAGHHVAFGVVDNSGVMQAAFPSAPFVEDTWHDAEEARAIGRFQRYPGTEPFNVVIKPIEIKRWDSKEVERIITLGKIVGVFSPAEVESKLQRIMIQTMLIMLLCSSLGVGVSYWVSRRMIVRPIEGLIGVTRRVAERRFVVPEIDTKIRELRQLWDAVRDMALEIGRFHSELERRVEERTNELAQANRELREAQDKMMRAEKLAAIGRLASGVGHELRNPLGAIKNAVYYIRDTLQGHPILQEDPTLKEFLDQADKDVQSATMIIGDLLDFSRVVKLVLEPTDVNALVRETKRQLQIPANVEWKESLPADLPHASVDRQKLKQVFINLANNAIQAMVQGGTLEVSTSIEGRAGEPGARLCVAFKDDGVGISPENMKKVYEPLFTTKAMGTGLGLAIALGIIQAHRGEIVTASELAKGSTFTVKVPLGGPDDGKART